MKDEKFKWFQNFYSGVVNKVTVEFTKLWRGVRSAIVFKIFYLKSEKFCARLKYLLFYCQCKNLQFDTQKLIILNRGVLT